MPAGGASFLLVLRRRQGQRHQVVDAGSDQAQLILDARISFAS